MNIPLPTIGLSGVFRASSPYDTIIKDRVSYTVTGLKTLSEIISNSEDPFKLYYEPYGISAETYKTHLKENITVISLVGADSNWVYVPAPYLVSYPDNTGIPYHVLSLAVTLGALPLDYNTSAVEELVKNTITDTVGVTPTINLVEVSGVSYLTDDEHDYVERSRELLIQNRITDTAKYRYALEMYHKTLEQLRAVECYITNTCKTGVDSLNFDQPIDIVRDYRTGNVTVETSSCVTEYVVNARKTIQEIDPEWYYKRSCDKQEFYSLSKIGQSYPGTEVSYSIVHYSKNFDGTKELLFKLDECKMSTFVRGHEFVSANEILYNEKYTIDYCGDINLKVITNDNEREVCISPKADIWHQYEGFDIEITSEGRVLLKLGNGRTVLVKEDGHVTVTDPCRITEVPVPVCQDELIINTPADYHYKPTTLKDCLLETCMPIEAVKLYTRISCFNDYKDLGTVISFNDPIVSVLDTLTLEESMLYKYYPNKTNNAFSLRNCFTRYKDLGETGTIANEPFVSTVFYDITKHPMLSRYPSSANEMQLSLCNKCYLVSKFSDAPSSTIIVGEPEIAITDISEKLTQLYYPIDPVSGYTLNKCPYLIRT